MVNDRLVVDEREAALDTLASKKNLNDHLKETLDLMSSTTLGRKLKLQK